jgi:1-acyl-sn-glycerol-3-phosphate acyltransferase
MYLEIPGVGAALRAIDPIPVHGKRARWGLWEARRRAGRGRPPLALALSRLAAGRTVGIFPEGTRNGATGALLRARRGLGLLILHSAAPVVPIGIAFPAAARLGRMPRLGRIEVRVGEVLAFREERESFRRAAAPAGPAGLRRGRSELAERAAATVMHRLAALCSKDYPHSGPTANEVAGRPPALAVVPSPSRRRPCAVATSPP